MRDASLPYPKRVRIDSKTDQTINDLARSWGVSRSDVVRMAVRHACLCENPLWPKINAKKTRATTFRLDLKTEELIDAVDMSMEGTAEVIRSAIAHIALCNELTWPLSDKALPTKIFKKRYKSEK